MRWCGWDSYQKRCLLGQGLDGGEIQRLGTGLFLGTQSLLNGKVSRTEHRKDRIQPGEREGRRQCVSPCALYSFASE